MKLTLLRSGLFATQNVGVHLEMSCCMSVSMKHRLVAFLLTLFRHVGYTPVQIIQNSNSSISSTT